MSEICIEHDIENLVGCLLVKSSQATKQNLIMT